MAELDTSVSGDGDRWILFDRLTADSYPLVVLARSGNPAVEEALRNGILTIVTCEADLELINDRGMPQHTDRLYPIEEGLAQELSAFDVGAFHVASVTGDGVRKIIYAHADPLNFEPVLGLFSPEGYNLSAAVADDRQAVADMVIPSATELQLNSDLGVIANLEKSGDPGTDPRRTDFWFYGSTQNLACLADELVAAGYIVDRWLEEPDGVVLHKEMSVDFGSFREVTLFLVGASERHGVTYDGWETFVLSSGGREEPVPAPTKKPSLLSRLFGPKKF